MSTTRSSTRRPPASRLSPVPPVYSLRRERTTKRRGELAELVFQLIATRMGFAVCKPYGDSERYDFVLDARQSYCHSERRRSLAKQAIVAGEEPAFPRSLPLLWRVQVKASTQLLNGLYRINAHRRLGRRAVPYRPGEIDFIAAYIIPEDTWYIIPLHAVRGTSLLFRRKKDRRPGLYDQYREAWHLLRPRL